VKINCRDAIFSFQAVTAAAHILKDSEKEAEHGLTLGSVAGAAATSHGSEQTSPLRGQMLTGHENDGAQSEAVIFAASEIATAEIPASPDVAVGNGATAPVDGPNVETENQTSVVDEVEPPAAGHVFAAIGGEAENVASAVNNSLSQEVLAAGNSAVPEIEPATRVNDDASAKPPAHSVHKNVKELWRAAIESKDRDELLRLFKEDKSNLEFERDGRTALHIAAMGVDPENLELAKLILNYVLEERQRKYSDFHLFKGFLQRFIRPIVANYDYVGEVESESGKTAMELARENSKNSRISKAICEHIIDTRRLIKAHFGIDRAVDLQEELEVLLKKEESDPKFTEHKKLLGQLIASRNCKLLLEYFKRKRSWDIWKYQDKSGRTVLHVAAIQGCSLLARQVLDLAGDKDDSEYIEAVDCATNLTALQMADDIIGNRSIAEYIKFTLERMKNKDHEHPCFFEAYPRTTWRRALSTGDSNLLKQLLGGNPRLLLETCKGLTVLHVAIMRQSLNLVKAVLELFDSNEGEFVCGESSYYPSKLTRKQMLTKKARMDESVFREWESKDRYGNPLEFQKSISALKDRMQGQNPFECSAKELVDFMQELDNSESNSKMINILEPYEHDTTAPDPGLTSSRHTQQHFTINGVMKNWKEEWDRGYMADVDFNFEQEPRLTGLRVLYASKYPLIFKEFLQNCQVSSYYSLRRYFLHDEQGRSRWHILLDHSDNKDHFPGRCALNEVCKIQLLFIVLCLCTFSLSSIIHLALT
jgi:ankyrin repeat protein